MAGMMNLRFSPLEWDVGLKALETGQVDATGKPCYLFFGTKATRDTVRAETTTKPGVGSVYFGRGEVYIKVADNGATEDWEVFAHSAADAG